MIQYVLGSGVVGGAVGEKRGERGMGRAVSDRRRNR